MYKTVNYNDLTSHCKHYFHLLVVEDDALNNKLNRLRNKLKETPRRANNINNNNNNINKII